MIKVMVAEDERPILRSIAKAIENQDPQFCVEFTAHNGKQAKEFLDTEKIDVAFLDINMPIHDGLWLLEYINSSNMDVISVILTGYQEFEYAQRALKAHAFDYLLKPLNEKDLAKILKKAKTELERKNREMILQVKADVPHCVFENPDGLSDRCWIASCFLGGYSKGELLDATIQKQKLAEQYIVDFLEEKLGKNSFWLAGGHDESERILFISISAPDYKKVLKELVESSQGLVIPLTIAVRTAPVKLHDINEVYKTLSHQVKQNMLFETSVLRFEGDRDGKEGTAKHEDVKRQDEKNLNRLLDGIWANSTADDLVGLFDKIIQSVGSKRHDIEYAGKSFFIRLCEKVPTQVRYLDLEEELLVILENEFCFEQLTAKIRGLIKEYFYVEMEAAENREALAQAMKEYVDHNYSFQFSNQILEERFGYSAFYLRSVFKEAHGMSPNDYLLKVRMEKAGELLKKNIHAKNVAEEVGFTDPLYFSKVFKKYTGLSPKEYRSL